MTYFDAVTYATAKYLAPTTTRDSARDYGYRVWLLAEQNNTCWDCEAHIPYVAEGVGEYTHIHRAAKGGVYVEGLGAIGCRECNLVHVAIADDEGSIPLRYIMSSDRYTRIPMGLPTRAECVRIATAHRAERDAHRAERIASALAECE